MRLALPTSIAILLMPFIVEAQETPSPEKPPTDVRKEMLAEYKFAAAGSKPAILPTSLQSEAPKIYASGTDKDVVRMEAFEVRETGVSGAAYQPLEQQSPSKSPATAASKLGIGEHDFKVGRLHAFVVTIFYVPLIAGFQW